MGQTAITYPQATVTEYTGAEIKNVLEQVADNIFNKDPYYIQGGDMIRVGGMSYTFDPSETIGRRCSEIKVNGKLISAQKKYKIAGWASMKQIEGKPVWDLVANYLRREKTIRIDHVDLPHLTSNMRGNYGIAFPEKYRL